ncbi:MAG: biotin/lipoyl-binding protein, partial [Rhodocyclaceae bacterium]|nr:biotin/lipoyl-binding protein [Rhodocyclaceae bacterium]
SALVKALRDEVGLPIHFHTHDTSGIAAASVLAAVEAGVDAVDGALDALSGLTAQPNLGSIVAALQGHERDPGVNLANLQKLSRYWEGVRRQYAPFEADIRAGTSDVYLHEMPGGQYTNLREQARAVGIDHHWPEVAQAYAQVNLLFGDIVKVTPTSKVVGDMALFMVTNGLTPAEVLDPAREIAFPESVVQLMRGELGYPADGFPAALQAKVLGGEKPMLGRAGDHLPAVDLDATRAELSKTLERDATDTDLASALMYPKVFADYVAHEAKYGDVSVLPTPAFFYGLADGEEVVVDIDRGKTLVIRLLGRAESEDGQMKLFFELNGQPRLIKVPRAGVVNTSERAKAQDGNPDQIGAPMPGVIGSVGARDGQHVNRGDTLMTLEAMKMELAIKAERDGTVAAVHVKPGTQVNAKDLLIEFKA